MMEDIRKVALAHAMELSRGHVMREASDIVKDASVFEAYLTRGELFPVNDHSRLIECCQNEVTGSCFCSRIDAGKCCVLCLGQSRSNNKDETLSGSGVTSHENIPSQKVNNCHPELPTPDDNKTVIPDGGSVTLHGSGGEVLS